MILLFISLLPHVQVTNFPTNPQVMSKPNEMELAESKTSVFDIAKHNRVWCRMGSSRNSIVSLSNDALYGKEVPYFIMEAVISASISY